MARGFRFKTHKLDLRGFEQWLRAQLEGSAFVAVVAVILSLVRSLFTENRALRERLTSRRPKPPSERMSALKAQLAFRFAVPANDAAPAPTTTTPAPEPDASAPEEPKKKRPPRSKEPRYPASLPHVAVFNALCGSLRDCADCGVAMVPGPMRCVMTLERTVETVYVLCRTDEVLCCPKCDAMVCAPAPPGVLHGGKLGPVLVAEALADRVLDGLPIERQARNFERRGVPIPASTLGRSVLALLREYLVPLAERVHARVERSAHLQLDATGLRVLVPEAPLGSERRTWWVFVGDGRWVSFRVAKEGSTVRLEEVLGCPQAASFQCDATSVTNFVESKLGRRRPGCHAHARRRLVEAARRGDHRALEGLRLYTRVFRVEALLRRFRLAPWQRERVRQRFTRRALERLAAWALALAPKVEPKSPLGTALTYLQRQWLRLSLFLFDGAVEATNNRSERELRPGVLGQHTWLFCGSDDSAVAWSAGYTLLHSALAHGLNPRAYLHAIVAKLLPGFPRQRLDELLPDAMLRAHPELALPAQVPRGLLPATASTPTPAQAA